MEKRCPHPSKTLGITLDFTAWFLATSLPMNVRDIFKAIGVFLGALFFLSVVYRTGPAVIQVVLRSATNSEEIRERRAEYTALANRESALTGAAKRTSEQARYRLFLWFHARGFPIDEGHESPSTRQVWKELIAYWKKDDGSSRYPDRSGKPATL